MLKDLTVVVPTFNRHEKLLTTLKILVGFDEPALRVLVIDNNSTPSVNDYLQSEMFALPRNWSIRRNKGNIGLGANLLMGLVECDTEWMWLLGDDDPPRINALSTISNSLRDVDESIFLVKFNSTAGEFPEYDFNIESEEEFCERCSNIRFYSNILFISNSLLKTKALSKALKPMFDFSDTLAPQIIGYLKCLATGGVIKVVNKEVVVHGVTIEDRWPEHDIKVGILRFADLHGHPVFQRKVAAKLYRSYFGGKGFYSRLAIYPFKFTGGSNAYWCWFYARSAMLHSGFKRFYLLVLSWFFPLLSQFRFLFGSYARQELYHEGKWHERS